MRTKPDNIALEREFYLNDEDYSNKRAKFVQAWGVIRRLNKIQLGRKSDLVHESYTQWVIDRVVSLGMPYTLRGTCLQLPHQNLYPYL